MCQVPLQHLATITWRKNTLRIPASMNPGRMSPVYVSQDRRGPITRSAHRAAAGEESHTIRPEPSAGSTAGWSAGPYSGTPGA